MNCKHMRAAYLGEIRDARFFRQQAKRGLSPVWKKDMLIAARVHVERARKVLKLIKEKGCPIPKGKVGIY